MELSRKVITRYWFHILGMTIVAYLPLILFVIYSGIHMFGIFFPIISRGGPIDFSQFTKFMGVALSFSLVQMLILVFVLPFACSSLMYAYEDIFGTRPAPAA